MFASKLIADTLEIQSNVLVLKAGKFDIIPLLRNLGAGLALLSLVSVHLRRFSC